MANIEKFSTGIVGLVVAVIVLVCVCIPIISANLIDTTAEGAIENGATINSLLVLLPLLITVGLMIGVIATFVKKA